MASQFNLLEMTGPDVTPEDGVARYAFDHTQGPACAIAAGAATIYRNYFAAVDDQRGQTATRQIDCLRDIGVSLGNANGALWTMRNGYALCSATGLDTIARVLASADEEARDALRARLRIGVHSDVQVTGGAAAPDQHVSQVFCSALPVSYTAVPARKWEPFARLLLGATYEATMWAAAENSARRGSNLVLLTRVGGGVFGNEPDWIDDAIRRALRLRAMRASPSTSSSSAT